MSVRVLLDVDGVLNAVTSEPGDFWPEWSHGKASPWPGRSFRIAHALGVADFIRELHEAGVEIVWLTTWGQHANTEICRLMDLPQFPVAGESSDFDGYGWWKLPLAQKLWDQDGTPFVWIDDDLKFEHPAQQWLSFLPEGHSLAISPETHQGITPEHTEQIWDFVLTHL